MSKYRTKTYWVFQIIEFSAVIVLWGVADVEFGWKWLLFLAGCIVLIVSNYCEGMWTERHGL
jgi:hypothetical protein